jgi:uroporphyrinogen-III synthase
VTAVRILVTRPEPDGEKTAQKLRARGCDVLLGPVLRIRHLEEADFGAGPWDAVAMTSANAAHALERHARRLQITRLPVLTVGRRTAEAAGAVGFTDIASANSNEQALAHLIGAHVARGNKVLYLAGEDRAGDLATAVAPHGVRVETVVVYRAVAAERLPKPAMAALSAGEVNGVLHFSRRSAVIYLDCARAAGALDRALRPFHYCLSQAIAEPLMAAGASRVMVAQSPEENALLDLIAPVPRFRSS